MLQACAPVQNIRMGFLKKLKKLLTVNDDERRSSSEVRAVAECKGLCILTFHHPDAYSTIYKR